LLDAASDTAHLRKINEEDGSEDMGCVVVVEPLL
jgi:hypothetical protein